MAVDAARSAAPPAAARPRRRARTRAGPRRRLASGVVWIGLVAVLLTGIVALNVAVLRLNLRLDNLNEERAKLRTENADLRARAADDAVPETIRTQAALNGYHWTPWNRMHYVELPPNAR